MKKQKGSIIISFMLLVFVSVVGTSLLTLCIIHVRSVRARTFKLVETDKIYQSVIYYLHQFREKVFKEKIQELSNPEIDFFNNICFPDSIINNEYFVSHSFRNVVIHDENYYKKTRIIADMAYTAINDKDNNYCIDSEVYIDVLSGEIPLTMFPFFLNDTKGMVPESKDTESFLKDNNIVNLSNKKAVVEKIDIEMNHADFLLNALKINGRTVTWREIRERFNLPISDLPIPEGIYIYAEGDVAESIFIQGDLERLIFSTEKNLQKIRIIQNSKSFDLSYIPKESFFYSWDYSINKKTQFEEKLIVNGSIWSLEQEGKGAFIPQSDIKLLVTGKAIISTSLETVSDQLDIKENLFNNLTLTCGTNQLEHLIRSDLESTSVMIDTNTSIQLQSNIIVEGEFINSNAEVKLIGGLFCETLENKGKMEIYSPSTCVNGDNYYHTVDFKYIYQFLIYFIEEV